MSGARLAGGVLAAAALCLSVGTAIAADTIVPRPHAYAARCSVQVEEALKRINAARAKARRCGWRSMPAAPPLRWDASLQAAATAHSSDMAKRNYFGHTSPEGRQVVQRVKAARYKYRLVGENLAGGDRNIASAVQGWIDSPSHCENLMNPKFVDVAVACVGRQGSQWGTYWTMVLGYR